MCDEEAATYVLTNLADGAVARIGANCFPAFILSIAEGMTGISELAADEAATATPGDIEGGEQTMPDLTAGDEPDTFQPDPKPSGRSPKKSAEAATDIAESPGDTMASDETALATS